MLKFKWKWDDTIKEMPEIPQETKENEITPQEETDDHHHKKNKKKKDPNIYIKQIDKLISENKDPKVITALEQLKTAITEVETNKPGITQKLVNRIIEILRR